MEAPDTTQLVPEATRSGQGRLTVLGFEVYDATLWVTPGFSPAQFSKAPLVLELHYLREFKARAIAERSIAEMRRQGPLEPAKAQQWQATLSALLPDVRKGDRLTGVYQPGEAVRFLHNGKPVGVVADPEFAELFIGIWLSPKTSEPKIRQALLGRAPS